MKWNLNEKLKENLRQLYCQLVDDGMKFCKYFKMSIQQFTTLLSKVQCDQTQWDTTFKSTVRSDTMGHSFQKYSAIRHNGTQLSNSLAPNQKLSVVG